MEIFIGTLVTLAIYIIWVNNTIISRYNTVKASWSDVLTQQNEIIKVLPVLEKAISGHKEYEKEVMTKVTELRTSAGGVQEGNINPSALNDVQSKIGALQTAINIVQENYPDLNTHELVTGYMKAVEETQKQVSAALRLFNANTMKYNETLQVFPNNIINNLISRKKKLSFYTDQQAEDNFTYKPDF